jgi:Ecdysteroid kinase-like family
LTKPLIAVDLPSPINAEQLSEALRRCGALQSGRVCSITVDSSQETHLSGIIRLRLGYDKATHDAPRSVIFKTSHPERLDATSDEGHKEVSFYTEVTTDMPEGLVPRCFEAHWDRTGNAWHLLLEDLTDSHSIATTWPIPPTLPQCEGMVRALARIHAHWWDSPHFGTTVGRWLDDGALNRNISEFATVFERFASHLGDRLSVERRVLYKQFIHAAPRLLSQRYQSHRNMTIVHGDAHLWNFFLPRDGGSDIRIFDWQNWCIDFASTDLAYMMATHWYPERRRRMEQPLLDYYHAALQEQGEGVHDFGRAALEEDYRLAVLLQLIRLVRQFNAGLPPVIWWGHLERVVLAIDDLGCRELLP